MTEWKMKCGGPMKAILALLAIFISTPASAQRRFIVPNSLPSQREEVEVVPMTTAMTFGQVSAQAPQSLARELRSVSERIRAQAEGCVGTTLSCNTTTRGRLAVGDCTLSTDGTSFDVYNFAGTVGKVVTIDVRPLSPTLTNPTVIIVPPIGDASKVPLMFGPGGGVSVNYVLSSSGTWAIGVGTRDLFASGDYFISLRCVNDTDPSSPQNCIDQDLLCGQTGAWNLTSQSCRFSGATNRLYAEFQVYGVSGDLLSVEEDSNDFQPLFGIYGVNGKLLMSPSTATASTATGLYPIPANGFYYIVATSVNDLSTGFFTVKMSCSVSGCLEPLALSQPQNVTIPYGGRATLTFDVSATEPLAVVWTEVSPDIGGTPGTGRTVLTPPLFTTTSYFANAVNPCGSVTSLSETVNVTPASRHRPVKH